jgi:hypothetical protein
MSGAPTSSTEPNAGKVVLSAAGAAPPSLPQSWAAGGCRGSGRSRCCVPTFSASGMLSATATLTHLQSGRGRASRCGGAAAAADTSGRPGRVTGAREAVAPAALVSMCLVSGRSARSAPNGSRTGTLTGTGISTRSRSHPDRAASRSGGSADTVAASGKRPRSGAVKARGAAGRARDGGRRQLAAPGCRRRLRERRRQPPPGRVTCCFSILSTVRRRRVAAPRP